MNKGLPKIDLERDSIERVLIVLCWGMVFITLLLVGIYYGDLPNKIPSHYNIKGEIDNYSSKSFIFILPVISLLLTALFHVLIKFPHKFNYPVKFSEEKTVYQYRLAIKTLLAIGLQTNLMFAFLTGQMVLSGLGFFLNLNVFIVLFMIVAELATIIIYLFKASKKK